jgi:hypothetical protein
MMNNPKSARVTLVDASPERAEHESPTRKLRLVQPRARTSSNPAVLYAPEPIADVPAVAPEAPASGQDLVVPGLEPTRRTRTYAFLALLLVLAGAGYVGRTAYLAFTDSFVAPMILSPDNDLVVENKLKLAQIQMERAHTLGEAAAAEADLAAAQKGVARLAALEATAANALEWTRDITSHQLKAGSADLGALSRKGSVLSDMYSRQRSFVAKAKADLASGAIVRGDYEREAQNLDQIRVAMAENGRARTQSELTFYQATLGDGSLGGKTGAPPMPEVVAAEYQLTRIRLETIRLQADRDGKTATQKAAREKLAKLDEVEAELKSRPLYQAVAEHLNVAFVPYTQISGVTKGAAVYDCFLGLFACQRVGIVAEMVPGEVVLPDPWGNAARGQYAVLDLTSAGAGQSKSLRVRRVKT